MVLPIAVADVLTRPDSAEQKQILVRLYISVEDVMGGQWQILFSPHD